MRLARFSELPEEYILAVHSWLFGVPLPSQWTQPEKFVFMATPGCVVFVACAWMAHRPVGAGLIVLNERRCMRPLGPLLGRVRRTCCPAPRQH